MGFGVARLLVGFGAQMWVARLFGWIWTGTQNAKMLLWSVLFNVSTGLVRMLLWFFWKKDGL